MLVEDIKTVVFGKDSREYRKFGLTIGLFLIAVGTVFAFLAHSSAITLIIIGGVLSVTGLSLPVILKPIFIIWMSLAVTLGFVMTRLLLVIIFYLIFTPASLVIKLIGKKLLQLDRDPNLNSYWIKTESKKYNPASSENQY